MSNSAAGVDILPKSCKSNSLTFPVEDVSSPQQVTNPEAVAPRSRSPLLCPACTKTECNLIVMLTDYGSLQCVWVLMNCFSSYMCIKVVNCYNCYLVIRTLSPNCIYFRLVVI